MPELSFPISRYYDMVIFGPRTVQQKPQNIHNPSDRLTIIAIAIIAYALTSILHEALGHGSAAILLGFRPTILSSLALDFNNSNISAWQTRVIAAAGTVLNLFAGLIAFLILKYSKIRNHSRYFVWLLMTINILAGAGYLLVSPFGNFGDWAVFLNGLQSLLLWKLLLTILGLILYILGMKIAADNFKPFLPYDTSLRRKESYALTLIPYLTGGILYCLAGLFNPFGMIYVLISAAAASFFGHAGMINIPTMLRKVVTNETDFVDTIYRKWQLIIMGVIVLILFVSILGPGIHF